MQARTLTTSALEANDGKRPPRLTRTRAQRVWGLAAPACDAILAALVDTGRLRSTRRGFIRK